MIFFIQQKGWLQFSSAELNPDNFIQTLFERSGQYQNDFLNKVLEPLFYHAFGMQRPQNIYNTNIPDIGDLIIPCFACSLFQSTEFSFKKAIFPADLFQSLFDLLASYSWTLDENTSNRTVNAIDPEIFGAIYETQLQNQSQNGTYYTPKEIVRFMSRESLISYLQDDFPHQQNIRLFVNSHCADDLPKSKSFKSNLLKKLKSVTICDPAIGSGAFAMGMLHELFLCIKALCPDTAPAEITRSIIQNSIYGVDIDDQAVEITKLRLYLALLSQADAPAPHLALDFHILQGNSLIENYAGVSLDKVAVHAPNKLHKQRRFDFSPVKNHAPDYSMKYIHSYIEKYQTSNSPEEIALLKNDIHQIIKNYILKSPERSPELKDADLIQFPGSQFMPWHILFPNIFDAGGFDIVIANPPYGVKMSDDEKKSYKSSFQNLTKKFDIYMVFFELGFNLSKNIICFITPDKWLSKSFALPFRDHRMIPYMKKILHLGNAVFETATVDAIISLFQTKYSDALEIMIADSCNRFNTVHTIDKNELKSPYLIDEFFQTQKPEVITQLEKFTHCLQEYARCEYASASPTDAYKLSEIIRQNPEPAAGELKILNTGLIAKYHHRWAQRPMKYLKQNFSNPVVDISELEKTLGANCVRHMTSPKLIIKGLNLLDACIDFDGTLMSTVATLNIRIQSRELLMVAAAIINSSLIKSYFKARYISGSYCGGLLFTPDMINQIPVPDLSDLSSWQDVIQTVQNLMQHPEDADHFIEKIDALIADHYRI